MEVKKKKKLGVVGDSQAFLNQIGMIGLDLDFVDLSLEGFFFPFSQCWLSINVLLSSVLTLLLL